MEKWMQGGSQQFPSHPTPLNWEHGKYCTPFQTRRRKYEHEQTHRHVHPTHTMYTSAKEKKTTFFSFQPPTHKTDNSNQNRHTQQCDPCSHRRVTTHPMAFPDELVANALPKYETITAFHELVSLSHSLCLSFY